MNILHLEASSGWGGQEIRILREMIALKERGFSFYLGNQKSGILATKAKSKGFPVFEADFRKRFWVFTFFKLIFFCKKWKIHCIVTHSSLDAWIGGIVAKLLKIPVIRTRHLSNTIRKGLNSRLLYNKLADYVVTTCKKIVPVICEQSGIPRSRCKSIPTGIEPSDFKISLSDAEAFRQKIGVKASQFLVGMVCFMRSWKGVEDFLRAAKFLENETDIVWILIGGGHLETYKKIAKQMDSKVIFTGHIENPFAAIQALDVFLLLSTANEGVSQASLQAAFLGKPLITTDTGGLGEVCVDQKTGIRVPCRDHQKVAKAVKALQADDARRRIMGENAKKLVYENFLFSKTLNEMEKVFCIFCKK